MLEQRLEYGSPLGVKGERKLGVCIFANGGFERRRIAEDCDGAGLHVMGHGELEEIGRRIDLTGRGSFGDIVVVDCPHADVPMLSILAKLDIAAARSGARLVICTSLHVLDDVFGCLDQSEAHILVRPSRAERMQTLSQLQHKAPRHCVREMSEEDRKVIQQLTDRIGQISEKFEQITQTDGKGESEGSAFEFETRSDAAEKQLIRQVKTALPDPRLVREVIRNRQKRWEYFGRDLFADPAWDMLLDLTAARAEHKRVSVTSLCIASGVPATTALRWIAQMVDAGLFERVKDETDARRAFIALTGRSAEAMARYFAELESVTATI